MATREQAKCYLALHRIPQMLECLLSCLMMETPDDPVAYIENKMSQIKDIGIDNVNWETFVYNLHPYRDNVRRELIQDDSKFHKEWEEQKKASNSSPYQPHRGTYKPGVFKLTEAQDV